MIDFLSTLHERAGRISITFLAMVLLGIDMFVGELDTTTLGIVVAIYVGGASVVKTASTIKVTQARRRTR